MVDVTVDDVGVSIYIGFGYVVVDVNVFAKGDGTNPFLRVKTGAKAEVVVVVVLNNSRTPSIAPIAKESFMMLLLKSRIHSLPETERSAAIAIAIDRLKFVNQYFSIWFENGFKLVEYCHHPKESVKERRRHILDVWNKSRQRQEL